MIFDLSACGTKNLGFNAFLPPVTEQEIEKRLDTVFHEAFDLASHSTIRSQRLQYRASYSKKGSADQFL